MAQQVGKWRVNGFFGGADYRNPNLECYRIEFTADQFVQEPVKITAVTSGTNTTSGAPVREQFDFEVQSLTVPGRWNTQYLGGK